MDLRRLIVLGSLLALGAAGCSCDTPGTAGTSGDLEVGQSSLAFGQICNGAQVTQELLLTNIGNGDLAVQLAVTGEAAAYFTVAPAEGTLSSGGGTLAVTVTYHPSGEDQANKHHFATLAITTDATDGTTSADVTLDGETAAAEPKPILSVDCSDQVIPCDNDPTHRGLACCSPIPQQEDPPYYGRDVVGTVNFGDTPAGTTRLVPLAITNFGCGPLTIQGVDVVSTGSGAGYCDAGAVAVPTAFPITLPGAVRPEDRQTASIELAFTPGSLCLYTGRMTIRSDDPDIAAGGALVNAASANLLGSGTEARITVDQSCLSYGEVPIGTPSGRVVHVSNVGTQDIRVTQLRFRASNPDFSVTKLEQKSDCAAAATELPLGQPFVLSASNAAPCGSDEVDITVTYTPAAPAGQDQDDLEIVYEGGVAPVCLRGGSNPILVAHPDGIADDLQFLGPAALGCFPERCGAGNQCQGACVDEQDCGGTEACLGSVCAGDAACVETCTTGDKVFRVCNEGLADLQFDGEEIAGQSGITLTGPQGGPVPTHTDPERAGQPVFELTANGCRNTDGSGKSLPNGQCCEATVHFSDARNGITTFGEVHLYSNDPAWQRPDGGYVISILASTAQDLDPIMGGFKASPDAGGMVMRAGEWVLLDASCADAADSQCVRDDSGSGLTFSWELVSTSGASGITAGRINAGNIPQLCGNGTVNGGNCFELGGAPIGSTLRFWPDIAGTYTFRLEASDGICNPPHTGSLRQAVEIVN